MELKQFNRQELIEALYTIITQSEYFYLLFETVSRIGFKFKAESFIMNFDNSKGNINIKLINDKQPMLQPELWVTVDEEELIYCRKTKETLKSIQISTSETGQILHPSVERIIFRCFGKPPYPLSDREELVYGGLFGFEEPITLWASSKSKIQALKICNEKQIAFVSSGFSSLKMEGNQEDKSMYELVLLTPLKENYLEYEFIEWVKHFDSKKSVSLGDWLEYEQTLIPQTNLAGFLVVPPISFKPFFPLLDYEVKWYLLLGVTVDELTLAKQKGAMYVAKMIFENGYQDITFCKRNSLV